MPVTKGIFGVTMTADGQAAAGYLKKVDVNEKVKRSEIQDEAGEVVDFAVFNRTKDASVEFWTKDGGDTPDILTAYNVDGEMFSLDETGKSQEIGGFQSHRAKGIRYVENALPA